MRSSLVLLALAAVRSASLVVQEPIGPSNNKDFHSSSVKTHKRFPGTNREQFSGYLTEDKPQSLFFWMLQSEYDPEHDPILLWVASGEPGDSALDGLFFRWGPKTLGSDCKVSTSPPYFNFTSNPAALNKNVTLVFIDQPGGVGFSSTGAFHNSSYAAADDVVSFITNFRDHIFGDTAFKKQPLHIGGEDSAGHLVPIIANKIVQSDKSVRDKVKLSSILIGNPALDSIETARNLVPFICDPKSSPLDPEDRPIPSICATFANSLWHSCLPALTACRSEHHPTSCPTLPTACHNNSASRFSNEFNHDPTDYTRPLDDSPTPASIQCLSSYLNRFKRDIGALNGGAGAYKHSNPSVTSAFLNAGDSAANARLELDALLTQATLPIPVLVYVGDVALHNNYWATKQVVADVLWPGQPAIRELLAKTEAAYPNLTLTVGADGRGGGGGGGGAEERYGHYVASGRLTYARIFGAGLNVVENRPKEARDLLLRWIWNGGVGETGSGFEATEEGGVGEEAAGWNWDL